MRSGLHFITSVPFTEAYRAGEQRSEQRRASDLAARTGEFNLSEAQRRSTEEQGVDAALRQAAQPPAPAGAPSAAPASEPDPVGAVQMPTPPAAAPAPAPAPAAVAPGRVTDRAVGALANVRGGGKIALGLAQAQEKARDQDETRMMEMLAAGRVQEGLYFANKIGKQLPPELLNNAVFWQGASIAKQLYPDDPAAGQRFTAAYVQAPGDINQKTQAAIATAGAPVKKKRYGVVQADQGPVFYNLENPAEQVAGPTKTQGTYMNDGQGNTVFVPTGQNQAQAVMGPDGQPLKAQKFGGRAPANSMLVKIGQNSGKLYPADHQGVGDDNEPVVVLPAKEATQLAVARGNNDTKILLGQMSGETKIGVATIGANAKTDVAETAANAKTTAAQTAADARTTAAETTAKGRVDAATVGANSREKVAQMGGTKSGKMSVYEQKRRAWLALHPNDQAGALEYASGRRQTSPAELTKMANQMARNEASGELMPPGAAWIQNRTQEILKTLQQPSEPNAGAGAPPAAPAGATGKSPYPDYPDARQGRDGKWYIERDGKFFVVE